MSSGWSGTLCRWPHPPAGGSFERLSSTRARHASPLRPPGDLAYHVAWVLVFAQALEAGSTEIPCPRPLGELDLGHQPRLDEVRTRRRPAPVEGRAHALDAPEHRSQLCERPFREARSHLARVHELATVVVADEKGAGQALPTAFTVDPARDHELLSEAVLHLQPGAAPPPRLIGAVEALGDHTL